MPKISDKQLRVIQIRIFEEDYQKLKQMYSRRQGGEIGINKALRAIIHTFLLNTEARVRARIDEIETQ